MQLSHSWPMFSEEGAGQGESRARDRVRAGRGQGESRARDKARERREASRSARAQGCGAVAVRDKGMPLGPRRSSAQPAEMSARIAEIRRSAAISWRGMRYLSSAGSCLGSNSTSGNHLSNSYLLNVTELTLLPSSRHS